MAWSPDELSRFRLSALTELASVAKLTEILEIRLVAPRIAKGACSSYVPRPGGANGQL